PTPGPPSPDRIGDDFRQALENLVALPGFLLEALLEAPGDFVTITRPENVRALVKGWLTQLDVEDVSPSEFQTRLRTATDALPFF
ncbi:MAG: hypothetical protein Q8R28_08035, partial [Dehalococcoidia bacterium]|nr:hypothetical protein [Dehalococcoidia bacterium]